MKPYAITITPADIVIFTGGTGYSGVLDDAGDFVGSMEQGLPEPGYHIDLPDSVEAWLTSHGVDLTQAANLADYLSFYYYDQGDWCGDPPLGSDGPGRLLERCNRQREPLCI